VSRSSFKVSVEKVHDLSSSTHFDSLATEEPLEIQLGYGPEGERAHKSISVTMRTPGHDFELAIGFLATEGVVHDAADIRQVGYAERGNRPPIAESGAEDGVLPYLPGRNSVCVELAPGVEVSLATLERNFYTTSSCGVCGKASLLALQTVCPPRLPNSFSMGGEILYDLPNRLRNSQNIFNQTGGLHAAALFSNDGTLVGIREDVGRHNAVDKLIGLEFIADRTPLRDRMLLLSGRASFELLQKAVMAGIPMVASVGAPSSLAVLVARQFDITLIGFLNENRFNIYHGAKRILVIRNSRAGLVTENALDAA
jgi:FdhD protein